MQLRGHQLDFPAGQFRIGFLALDDLPFHGDNEFAARLLRFGMRRRLRLFIENNLHDAGAITNIEKEQIAKVAPPRHPAHDVRVAAFVLRAQFAAVVCALQIPQKIQQVFPFLGGTDFSLCPWISSPRSSDGRHRLPTWSGQVPPVLLWDRHSCLSSSRSICPTADRQEYLSHLRVPLLFAFANVPANRARCTLLASRPPASSASTSPRILHYHQESAHTSRRVYPPGQAPCQTFVRRAAAPR